MVTKESPATAVEYVRTINEHDSAAFVALFSSHAVVNDVGREFRGIVAIATWSEREIFTPKVSLRVITVAERGEETIVTTEVNGNFDRTGLPDPVVIDHHIKTDKGKITELACRLK